MVEHNSTPEGTPAFGEVSVIANVDADLANCGVEDRVAAITRTEVELLPKAADMWNVLLAVLAEVGAVGINNSRGVVEDAGLFFFVHRQHHDHL